MMSAPIAGCTIVIGAKKAPASRHADAEHDDRGHVGLQPGCRGLRPCPAAGCRRAPPGRTRVLCSTARRRPARRRPRPGSTAVAREQEITCQPDRARRRYRRGQVAGRPDDADRLFGDHCEPTIHQQAQDRIRGVERAGCSVRTDAEQGHRTGDSTTAGPKPDISLSRPKLGAKREESAWPD